MAIDPHIKIEKNGSVTTVGIDRPKARNACSVNMVQSLHTAFMAFEADDAAKIAVPTGTGIAFCTGAYLKEIQDGSAVGYCWASPDEGVTQRNLSKPVIAGISLAAGLALAI